MAKEQPKHKTTYDIANELGIMALAPNALISHAMHCASIGKTLVILGRPGVGKTDIVGQIMKRLKKLMHVERFNGKDPTDLGFPYVYDDERGTKRHAFTIPKWYVTENDTLDKEYSGGIGYFFDEFLQAVPAMQNRVCEIIDGSLNGVKAHPLTWPVIAANFAQDKAATYPMPRQIPNRASVVILAPGVEDSLQYMAEHDIRPELCAFVKLFSECLDSYDPDSIINCTPRSLCSLSPLMDKKPSFAEELALYSSIIGKGYASQLVGFLQTYRDLPTLEDIIAGPDKIKLPDEDKTDVMCALAAMLGRALNKTNATPVARFLVRLPSEFCVFALRDAVHRDPLLKKTRALNDWARIHGDVLT